MALVHGMPDCPREGRPKLMLRLRLLRGQKKPEPEGSGWSAAAVRRGREEAPEGRLRPSST